jgi:hypothetical protein
MSLNEAAETYICVIATNDGAMVASNIPRRNRQIIRPVKLVAAAETVVTVLPDQREET